MSRPTVTAFRGAPSGHSSSPGAGLPPSQPADPPESPRREPPLLAPAVARALGFLALGTFGALHWMQMLEPAATGRAWAGLGAAAVTAAGLLASARARGWARASLAAGGTIAGLALALVAAGVPGELLQPSRWDQLAAGVARGVDALAGARVPYRGLDEWMRLVIPLGGTLLLVLAAMLAFWPRRSGLGFAFPALVALVALYAVPAVALIFDGEFARGALLAVLVVAFLRLERLRRRDAPPAAGVAALTVVLALMLAPALDGIEPWWDYETWALSAAGSRSTSFDWTHDYGPLDWPRDGRELLRVKSRPRTYWKADQLDVFDGQRWQPTEDGYIAREAESTLLDGVEPRNSERWTYDITVSIRNLRSQTFVTAGTIESPPRMPRRATLPTSRAGVYRTTRSLQRGDVYRMRAYVPQPEPRDLRRAGAGYSVYELGRYTQINVDPAGTRIPANGRPLIRFPRFGLDPVPGAGFEAVDAVQLLEGSRLARTWALAQELREDAATPYEYLRAVQRHLSRGYGYSERPPQGSETLDGFLFDTKVGYCQQFSGAMALLMRMGGIPTRVATGFSPGSYDEDTGEHVVRDMDAHSWVEVWFGGVGWVPFDPTPTTAPPRAQASTDAAAVAGLGDVRDIGVGTIDPRRGGESAAASRPWGVYGAAGAAAVVLLLAGRALLRRRRRGRPEGFELERALRIVEGPAPGVTLSALEQRFAAVPGAAGYVRALRAQRYAAAGHGPTPAQRRGLRRALARGRGIGGRLRAWWALPPRPPHLR